jgi:hypothetical protein
VKEFEPVSIPIYSIIHKKAHITKSINDINIDKTTKDMQNQFVFHNNDTKPKTNINYVRQLNKISSKVYKKKKNNATLIKMNRQS